ncbi:MAG: D-tyrosyl-tRNA(Tyr) deacylase [Saprospiraceae bacterium]|nr:D-tyrosyl-tRNA(Tyr) deacylase [Saprospiraceae bacterium]
MRAVVQRVKNASVEINGVITSSINQGLLVLLGVEENDDISDVQWLSQKIVQMRIFSDSEDKMNLSVLDIDGEVLIISQFTLFASTKKGNRPSFIKSAKPDIAIPLYEEFIHQATLSLTKEKVSCGIFGADMKVALINDGPVTIIIDSKNRE